MVSDAGVSMKTSRVFARSSGAMAAPSEKYSISVPDAASSLSQKTRVGP